MKLIGNFDAEGRLTKLHLNPVEECNVDDSKDKREMECWAEAFEVMADIIGGEESGLSASDFLCLHCGFAE
jgi:hypothetical protein